MTDGALPRLCTALSRLSGFAVQLRDPDGHVIEPQGDSSWAAIESPAPPIGALEFPLLVDGARLGAIVVSDPTLVIGGDGTGDALVTVVELLASTVAEVCEGQVDLQHRLDEIRVLYRLSSLLASAGSVDEILAIGLDSTLDVLGLDAGAIMLLTDQADPFLPSVERDLVRSASRNLSERWLSNPNPLSRDRVFDRLALGGEVVAVEDLREDHRVALAEEVRREGLVSAIHAGMVFGDRPVGVIRAYARHRRRFDASDERLVRSISHQLAVAVEQARLMRVQEEEQRIQRQLHLAGNVQRRMLPRSLPGIPSLEVAAKWIPSVELSGDFYDYILPEGGRKLGVVVGDVVGKGVPAALMMSAVRASLRAHADEGHPVDETLERVNRDLCRDTRQEEFATIWYGLIDPEAGSLEYASAGHDTPLLIRPGEGGPRLVDLPGHGMVAGVDDTERYERFGHELLRGDVLVVFTDGVTDAMNFNGERFGRARLVDAVIRELDTSIESSAACVLDAIFREVRSYTGIAPRTDDRTVVVIRLV